MINTLKQAVKRMILRRRHDGLELGRAVQISGTDFGRNVRLGDRAIVLTTAIGDRSYIGPDSVVVNCTIGKYCSVASGVHLGSGSHPSRSAVSSHPIFHLFRPAVGWSYVQEDRFSEFQPTKVGNDVWIGARAIIRDGITIGDGAIVGAGAVVVKDVPPFAIVGGVPARLIRHRFSDEQIAFLQELRWWDKDEAWLRAHTSLFQDIDALIREQRTEDTK